MGNLESKASGSRDFQWIGCVICSSMIFLGMCIGGVSAADYVLSIDGPDMAFEGEDVVFSVLLDGLPVQARVVFGEDNSTLSDESTGLVSFIMPQVPFAGEVFEVEAWVAGNVSAVHQILVKNQTGALKAEFSDEDIDELENFSILIYANDELVVDAEVWFISQKYTTDAMGQVELVAPDVLVTTNYGISIQKSGYGSCVDTVRVNQVGKGIQLMEIVGPRIVSPDQLDLEYYIMGFAGGIEGVTIRVFYEDNEVCTYTSDVNGRVVIDAPTMINQEFFVIHFSKSGYKLLSGLASIEVFLFDELDGMDLSVDLIPSEVNEGELVRAQVTDQTGIGVKDAQIWVGGSRSSSVTDASGVLEFRSPVVFFDQEQYICAIKEGYNFDSARLTIRNNPLSSPALVIDVETVVNASSMFLVSIADLDDGPVGDVEVWFNGEHVMTNESGDIWLLAPEVEDTEVFMINASREGFVPSSAMVEITASTDVGAGALIVSVVPSVLEGDRFSVTVKTDSGLFVSGARVSFQDTLYYTDYTGSVEIVAPEVSWDDTVEIVVSRVGYVSSASEVVIKNVEGFPYWFIVAVIVVVLIVGVTMYYRNRYRF